MSQTHPLVVPGDRVRYPGGRVRVVRQSTLNSARRVDSISGGGEIDQGYWFNEVQVVEE